MDCLGMLALSRALGDIELKSNKGLGREKQIVTGNLRVNKIVYNNLQMKMIVWL